MKKPILQSFFMSDTILKGRGAQKNVPNRFFENSHEVMDEYLNFCEAEGEEADKNKTNYIEVFPKTFVNKVNSPDVGMGFSANPYQGCEHGCVYCYARPTHEYLGLSAEHKASFRRYLRERVESLVRPKVFHYINGEADLPLDECERYSDLLKAQEIDLDASCVMFDAQGKQTDAVWFRQLKSKDGSVVHTGDNRTGAGDGDDEQITVDLTSVPANVKSLVFVVNSFTGQNFSQIENATCRIVNANDNKEIARFNLSTLGAHNAQIMAKLYRHDAEWKLHAIGEIGNGRTFDELMPQITPHL